MAQQFDDTDIATTSSQDPEEQEQAAADAGEQADAVKADTQPPSGKSGRIDWRALGIVLLIAAIFAIAGRLYGQPTTSLVPVAVISASGCGLFITALRKLRTAKGAGLLDAALAGLMIAVLQFILALSYPGVIPSLGNEQLAGPGFYTTWGLIALFSTLFSVIGATLGHLAFAPPRPLPAHKARARQREPVQTPAPQRTTTSYAISILLLGLLPTLAGYLFGAAFDYALSRNGYAPGPFPTLHLLSALLPWQVPDPVGLQGANTVSFTLSLLWRIPLFFGNPAPFDAQALEPLVFNAAGLALLLMLSLKQENQLSTRRQQFSKLLAFEALFGLVLVLPANLWMWQGLQGILQFHTIIIPLGTLRLLDPLTFALNLLTAPLLCIALGTLINARMKHA